MSEKLYLSPKSSYSLNCIKYLFVMKGVKRRCFEILNCLRWQGSYKKCRSDKIIFLIVLILKKYMIFNFSKYNPFCLG